MTVVDLFTIQIIQDAGTPGIHLDARIDPLAALMAEAEENLTDLLPPGYRARIRRWDHPDEGEENDA